MRGLSFLASRRGCLSLLFCWCAALASAQPPEDWPFERLFIRDGRELPGLLLSQRADAFEFAEIVRRRNQPIYAVIRLIPREKVTLYQPLGDAERSLLMERYVSMLTNPLRQATRSLFC